jgi:alanyl-tRNA synthetase
METGAMAIFEERYGEQVRLVRVGEGISLELCGGTHTGRTGDIGLFKIVSESAVGANLRRIEALTGKAALEYTQRREDELRAVSSLLKTTPDQIRDRVDRLLNEQKEKEREIESLKSKLLSDRSGDVLDRSREINGIRLLTLPVEAATAKDLREYADRIKERMKSGIAVLGAKNAEKVMLVCVVTKDLTSQFQAGDIIKRLSEMVGGKGGGRPDMAQGGGNQPQALDRALESVEGIIRGMTKDG